MTPEQIAQQREIDEEILAYVRGLQDTAPISRDSIHAYLVRVRRRSITEAQTIDRINDLTGRGLLLRKRIFEAGRGYAFEHEVSPRGRAMLDRAEPWDWEE